MPPDFIRLSVNERNLQRLQQREPTRWLPRPSWCWLRLYDLDGTPLLMTRGYLRSLARQGYVGLAQIPRECIVP